MDDVILKRTWAEIDLDALAHNYHQARSLAGPGVRYLGVVKADAYGHGAVQVAACLERLGAEYLAVASLDEARELRRGGIQAPILILGHTPPEMVPQLTAHKITQTVSGWTEAEAYSAAASACGETLKVQVKVDTGMSRLGFQVRDRHFDNGVEAIAHACVLPGLEAEGIFTHFSVSDEDGGDSEAYTRRQFAVFARVLEALAAKGRTFALRHCANSGALARYPEMYLDMVRPGIALYGHYPAPSCEGLDGPGLKPVMALYSRVAAVRAFPADTPVSYGCTASFGPDGGRTAVLPIGYADGLHRALSNRGSVWLDGHARPIMGRVCMDMCMAALPPEAQVKPGDVAEVFGAHLPVEEHARLAGTIQYELLCGVSPRVPRIYLDA